MENTLSPTLSSSINLAAIWSQGDTLSRTVAVALLVMSLASWSIILAKAWSMWRLRAHLSLSLDNFWQAPGLAQGLILLRHRFPFYDMARQGQGVLNHLASHHQQPHLDAHLAPSDLVTRALRNSMSRSISHLETGLTILASIGSTAPFVGLLGTVWGIYHALARIGATGQASLDKVAGPVGEALIMTAAGLFVAIPAVLAYNLFARTLRLTIADMEAFAHDLHAYFTMGHPLESSSTHIAKPAMTESLKAA